MSYIERKFYVLLDVMEAPPKIKKYCRRHKLELDLLSMPLAKACVVCGQSRPLRRREVFWPAIRRGTQRRNCIWNVVSQSLRPLIFVVAIAAGLAMVWQGVKVGQRSAPFHHQRIAAETLISSESIVNSPTHAGYKQMKEASTISKAVVSGTSQREPLIPETKEGSAVPSVEAEFSTIEGGEIKLGVAIDSKNSDGEHGNQAKVARPVSNGDSRFESADDMSNGIARRVSEAISARAISGVQVSYVQSIVYLGGKVKTQSQRLAAEQAARSVLGVKQIRSSIRVEWETNRG